ncbi:MAG: DUF4172 domain-containing protein [Planctomycetota bacterium]
MAYIHELPDWPDFTWDSQALAGPLAALRHKQGRHLGKMEALGFELRTEASLSTLTEEVVKSAAIEGEHLDHQEVRSSIARKLGLDAAGLPEPGRNVEGTVAILLERHGAARYPRAPRPAHHREEPGRRAQHELPLGDAG